MQYPLSFRAAVCSARDTRFPPARRRAAIGRPNVKADHATRWRPKSDLLYCSIHTTYQQRCPPPSNVHVLYSVNATRTTCTFAIVKKCCYEHFYCVVAIRIIIYNLAPVVSAGAAGVSRPLPLEHEVPGGDFRRRRRRRSRFRQARLRAQRSVHAIVDAAWPQYVQVQVLSAVGPPLSSAAAPAAVT